MADTALLALTTEANGATVSVHDRMPAIIEPKDFAAWLDGDRVSADDAAKLLKPAADDALDFFEIGPEVNKATSEGPALQTPLERTFL